MKVVRVIISFPFSLLGAILLSVGTLIQYGLDVGGDIISSMADAITDARERHDA